MSAALSRLTPPEGWLSVVLVYLMGLSVAWAIDDSLWFNRSETHADYLQLAVVGGITISFIAVRVGWGRWTGHAIGACFAALIIPLWVGQRVAAPDASLWELCAATATQLVQATFELADTGRIRAAQFLPTLLLLGILVWGTGMFAATAVFRHRRPFAAITALGILLLVNISLTLHDQLGYLVLFSAASLLLLVRLHAVDEQTSWIRARLGDPRAVRSHTLRAGTAFVLAAVVGSFALTQTAVSAPLQTVWPEDLEDGLVDVGKELANYFPFVTSVKGPSGQDFSSNAAIQSKWTSDGDVAFTASMATDAPKGIYWRATAYDRFDTTSRVWSPASEALTPVPAGTPVLEIIADPTVTDARIEIPATVTPADRDEIAFSPGLPVSFDQDTDISMGPSGSLIRVFVTNRDTPYQVTGTRLKPETSTDPSGVSANKLRAAGRGYPSAVVVQYAAKPDPGTIGPASLAFLGEIRQEVGNVPYDIAARMEERFRGEFRYLADLTTVDCAGNSMVECFMVQRKGYCMYFATAMISLLREAGIPARLIMGFLPGTRSTVAGTGVVETVTHEQAHAWVEVFFPGWGWVPFDPTATQGLSQVLPAGRAVPSPAPGSNPSVPPNDIKDPTRIGRPTLGTPTAQAGAGAGPLIVAMIGLLLIVAVAALVIIRIRGGRRGDTGAPDAYRRVVGIASRLGYAPRPSQTIYEYADALGRLVPVARADLMTVADARVETAYGRHKLGSERMVAVADAARRLRVSLLRLFFRRGSRGRTRTVRPPRR